MKRVISFVLFNYRYYTRSDLKIIHEKLSNYNNYIIHLEIEPSSFELVAMLLETMV